MQKPRWLSLLVAYVAYTGYGLGAAIVMVVFTALQIALFAFPRLRRRAFNGIFRWFLGFYTRTVLPLLGVYTIRELSGVDRLSHSEPVIYCANHPGRLDGPLLLGILRNTSPIIKQRYARIPPYSLFIKTMDFINIDPHSLQALTAAFEQCRHVAANGRNLLVFPEGTRSASRTLLPFRELAFRIAVSLDIPVVPIVLYTDTPFMTRAHGSHFPQTRFGYYVRILPPLRPHPDEPPRALADRVRKAMLEQYRALQTVTDHQENKL